MKELDKNADSIYKEICILDSEFKNKIGKSKIKDSYYSADLIKKWENIKNTIEELSFEEKEYLFDMLKKNISEIGYGYASTIIGTAYESLYWMIKMESNNYKGKK